MKKFLTYLLIIVVAVAIIGRVYWLVTCPSEGENGLEENSRFKLNPMAEPYTQD